MKPDTTDSRTSEWADVQQRDVAFAHNTPAYGRLVSWIVVLVIAADFFWLVATNPNFEWHVVLQWFTESSVMDGLEVTLGLTLVSMVIGVVLGLLLAIARLSDNRLLNGLSALYIWFFRGTPLLVQLIFWYNLSTLFPTISLTIPLTGPTFVSWNTNDLITPLTAAIAGLALNEAAYMAEIIRAGLLSVEGGQVETAQAFGMSHARALRRIIIPQAMRSIIPPTANQLISMIKATSLVSVIAMGDLLYSVQSIYNRTFEIIPMLMVAVIWYLLITSILSVGQSAIERYYARGTRRTVVVGKRRAVSERPTTMLNHPLTKEEKV
ncbi:amino acid ABC transporter permease [Pectobacteriaceae bacterium CE70]|uniref:Glutamate/aspartate import permease protein GltK n=1 Tax=Serratia sp. (strain ATCC 39006) TaxID=104623 RepID=A0A2I5T3M7_SERS3|nr:MULTISPECIES: amino acid ABC transporter permease [Enterobacterales]WJV62239.1 amino acid ABC transporter permease [Pectobacteriaceae bacterium C52]WJV66524.1 amino acid ABC transporter permease [Pectobacteriaceae bacterium CE70]WJY10530.1 amino acid ABC transporter permease [Pectobacteriaceae bacterium C80]AUG99165.1 amino acid ABC transporter permease [Serratia sp. ATCC 39006]AUH03481.1 amino acid ABC transporter permease [Serratia sp. ATCC 39006]